MDWLWDVDWRGLFVPDLAILEIVIRGTIFAPFGQDADGELYVLFQSGLISKITAG